MATHTQTDKVLTLTLPAGVCGQPHDIACQITGASYTVSTPATVEATPVACGGDPVVETSADRSPGSIQFDVFKDTTDKGLSTLMMLAAHTGAPVDFVYQENPSDPTISWKAEGQATFQASALDFTPGGTGKHSVTMDVQSDKLTFPNQIQLPTVFADLASLKADSTSGDGNYAGGAFTSGQYVLLGDGTCAHYASDAWSAGAAA